MCNIQFDEGKTIHQKMAFCLTFDQSDSAVGLVSLKPGHLHLSRTLCSEHYPHNILPDCDKRDHSIGPRIFNISHTPVSMAMLLVK